MIIITFKSYYDNEDKHFICHNKNYISAIEYIDNGINEIITKSIFKEWTEYLNLAAEYHNPIGPSFIWYDFKLNQTTHKYHRNGYLHRDNGPAIEVLDFNGSTIREYYYINGVQKLDR